MTSYILQLAGPVATIIAATVAVFVTLKLGRGQLQDARQQAEIAERQAHLAAVRLQHDLFERRFVIFDAAMSLVKEAIRDQTVSRDERARFAVNTAPAAFLLSDELNVYLDELGKQAIALGALADMVEKGLGAGQSVPAERARLATWFLEQRQVVVEKFKPIMALDPGPRA
jgi:hypothetical protein